MPWGVQTGWQRQALPKPEILSYPLETNVLDSAVINASGVAADASGPYLGRRYLLAGTILSKRGDNTYERYVSGGGQNVAGILFDTVEFADATSVSNEPVAFLRRNVSFDSTKIIDFATYAAVVRASLSTCEFV
jgi:hypothetical protein